MSLRDRNKTGNKSVAETSNTGTSLDKAKGSLRKASEKAIAKPGTRGIEAITKASSKVVLGGAQNIAFIFDATASRSLVWESAKQAFQQMFESLGSRSRVHMKFMTYGGNQITDHFWTQNLSELCDDITKVECVGGSTQINKSLMQLIDGQGQELPNAIIFVGDCYEETDGELDASIRALINKKIRVFTSRIH